MKNKTISEIPYLEILKRAVKLAWENKFLWVLGIFIALVHSDNISFFSDFSGKDPGKDLTPEQILSFWQAHHETIIIVSIICIVVFTILGLLSIVARGGLISSISKLESKKPTDLKDGIRSGKRYFGKILGLNLLVFFAVLIIFGIVSLPSIYCFMSGKIAVGILTAIPAVVIFILVAIVSSFIRLFGQIYIATSKIGIFPAIENAYKLFQKNIWTSIIMGLFFIPLNFAFGIAAFLVILALGIFFLIPGIPLWLIFNKPGIIAGLFVAVPITFAALTLFSSIYKVFEQTVWYLFFKEIATEKSEEVLEEIKETDKIILAKSEPAGGMTPSEID